eukprot:1254349-Alexandrium_andersonii.AAC.1
MCIRDSTSTEHEMRGAEGAPADAGVGGLRAVLGTDADVPAERSREGNDPAHVPLLHGCRLGELQD